RSSAHAAAASFAGTWELNKAKSEGLTGRFANAEQTWTVTQDAKALTVETKVTMEGQDPRPTESVYSLDGSETSADLTRGQMSGKNTTKAKWGEGNKTLETSAVFVGKRDDQEVKNTT